MPRWKKFTAIGAVACLMLGLSSRPAPAAVGDLVATVTFSQPCQSSIGVGIAFDGQALWYSCYSSSPDLYRADPLTGQVLASYNIAGGLGALAYDAGRNAIWAGWGGSGVGQIRLIQLDANKQVTQSQVQFTTTDTGWMSIDDGLAYDASDDSLYVSPDVSETIHHYDAHGHHLLDGPSGTGDFEKAGNNGCENSGVALGGDLLYEGTDGCSHVFVVRKSDPATVVYDFSTTVAGDPNFRDEDLECDTNTFAAQGKHVMWSKEAYAPMRAHAYEIPYGSCGIGGQSSGPSTTATLSGTKGNYPWYVSAVIATLTATRGSNPIAVTQYRLNGGGWQNYSGPIVLSADGTTTLGYRSIDSTGMTEAEHTMSVQIDRTRPLIAMPTIPDPVCVGGPLHLGYTAVDATSGLASSAATLDGHPVGLSANMAAGQHLFRVTATDVAGNQQQQSIRFRAMATIDWLGALSTPPVWPASDLLPIRFQPFGCGGSFVHDETVRITVSPAGSALPWVSYTYGAVPGQNITIDDATDTYAVDFDTPARYGAVAGQQGVVRIYFGGLLQASQSFTLR